MEATIKKHFTPDAVVMELANGNAVLLSKNRNDKPTIQHYTELKSGINKGKLKLIEGYYFETEESRSSWVSKLETKVLQIIADKNKKKQILDEAKKSEHPFKVGSILYASWGYEQTNINFYEVIEVNKQKVVLREIKGERMKYCFRGSYGGLKPLAGEFTGEAFSKIVKARVWDEKVSFHIGMEVRGNLYNYDAGEEGVYFSDGY